MSSCMIYGTQRDLSWKVWNENNPNDQIFTGSGYCIHHINGIHEDNRIKNLQKMTNSEHTVLHMKGKSKSEKTKRKISEAKKGRMPPNYGIPMTEEQKKKISETKSKEVIANYKYFKSINDASKVLKVDPSTITYRIRTKKPGYYFNIESIVGEFI